MHKGAMDFLKRVKRIYPAYFQSSGVLEIGSLNINGTARVLFDECGYTGIDLMHGKGVDFVEHATEHLKRGVGYNVIISTEALEHDRNWRNTIDAAMDMLAKYGLLIITAAGPNRPEHGTHSHTPEDSPATLDYYGNITKDDLLEALTPSHCGLSDVFVLYECEHNEDETDIYFYGIAR